MCGVPNKPANPVRMASIITAGDTFISAPRSTPAHTTVLPVKQVPSCTPCVFKTRRDTCISSSSARPFSLSRVHQTTPIRPLPTYSMIPLPISLLTIRKPVGKADSAGLTVSTTCFLSALTFAPRNMRPTLTVTYLRRLGGFLLAFCAFRPAFPNAF